MLMKITRITIVLALSGQVAIASAAIPGVGGVISACYDKQGTMRVIDAEAGQACSNKESPLTMNQTGQTGQTGPTGPMGPVGPSDAYVTDFGGFSPFLPTGVQTVALLEVPGGEYVIEALLRFRANTLRGDPANIHCELIAEVGGTGELDFFTVSFTADEYNGHVKLAPMVGWVQAPGGFFIRVDCENADADAVDDIGVDESRLVAVKYGDVHVPPTPPPGD